MLIHLILGAVLGATPPAGAAAKGAPAATAKPAAAKSAPAATAKPAAAKSAEAAPAAPQTYAYIRDERTGAIKKVSIFAPEAATTGIVKVADETIMLKELSEALAASHMQGHSGAAHQKKRDFTPVLNRLVSARLIVVEGRQTGLDDLPEVVSSVDEFRTEALRALVKRQASAGAKPDPAEVDSLYKDSVREWKLRSVLIAKEEDAKAMQAQLKAGKPFEALAKQLVADKKAKGNEAAEFVGADRLLPAIVSAVQPLKVGGVSAPAKTPDGFVIAKVEDIRYPENAAARERATETALGHAKNLALRSYYESLVKRDVKKDDKLLEGLDFEAKTPGFDALAKDKRPLAQIQGANTITVADLADAMQQKYFHGVKQAAEGKRLNRDKVDLFEELIAKRLFDREAARAKLAETPEFKRVVADYTNSVVFGTFLQKVILPSIKVSEPELKRYFEKHKAEYTYPAFYKLDGIAFAKAQDAQSALEKLTKGTDLRWMRANSAGQIDPDHQTLHFAGTTLTAKSLPKDLASALASSSKPGSYRLYSTPEGQHYVIQVIEATPPTVQPYQEAREVVGQKVFEEKVNRAVEDYAVKLRKAYKPNVLITRLGN